MQRDERAERSRRAVLDAALFLFSRQGFRATSVRDIAERAKVSTGAVYHHFEDKEQVFRALIAEYEELLGTTRFPFMRVLRDAPTFPANIEELGYAARDSVRQFRQYLALVYVDVIEFNGTHIQHLYAGMARRFTELLEEQGAMPAIQARLRPSVSPISALLLTTRIFFNYFSMEILFGVKEPFGKETPEVVKEIADIVRNGICKES